ncbi:hypothetical protein ACFPA8_07700 [Streptomyces ovatisporus]|uniref:Uncharacterized protein n=1 Tax=Streptomyces ovatisporus TaxID=1128682 RepID=A0ABV9A356_9ACTN
MGCAECEQLRAREINAMKVADWSEATDARVLLAKHQREAHSSD